MPGAMIRIGGGYFSMVRIWTGEVWLRSSRPGPRYKGVLLIGGRVVQGRVESDEVVPLGVHLGAAGANEPQTPEDGPDVVDHPGDGMNRARPLAARGKGQIQPFRVGGRRFRELPRTVLERLDQSRLHTVGRRAGRRSLLAAQTAQLPEQPRDQALPCGPDTGRERAPNRRCPPPGGWPPGHPPRAFGGL